MPKFLLIVAALTLVACGSPTSGLRLHDGLSAIIGGDLVTSDDVIAKRTVGVIDVLQGAGCTGTLISKNVIVTAAHCAQAGAKHTKIVVGLNLDTAIENKANVFEVVDIKVNERYAQAMDELEAVLQKITDGTVPGADRDAKLAAAADNFKDWGDVALIKFKGDLPATYEVADLLGAGNDVQNGSVVTLAGYGLTKSNAQQSPVDTEPSILHKVNVKVADAHLSATEVSLDQTSGKGACHGDSGGPAYLKVGNDLKLFGVTSRGLKDPDDTCGKYAAYTYLPAYKAWIDETLAAFDKPQAEVKTGAVVNLRVKKVQARKRRK